VGAGVVVVGAEDDTTVDEPLAQSQPLMHTEVSLMMHALLRSGAQHVIAVGAT
jgi:hypothetical protein